MRDHRNEEREEEERDVEGTKIEDKRKVDKTESGNMWRKQKRV